MPRSRPIPASLQPESAAPSGAAHGASPDAPPLSLTLLGDPAWTASDGTRRRLPPRDALLLAVLALDGARSREALSVLLWPDATPKQQRANLRQRIKRLQDQSDQQLFAMSGPTGATVALGPGVQADVADPAGAAGEGPLLGTGEPEEDTLADWLDSARQRFDRARRQALVARAEREEQAEALDAAQGTLERLTRIDPLDEDGHCRLVALLYRRGHLLAAQRVYQRHAQRVQDELGAEPGPDIRSLAALVARARQDDRERMGVSGQAMHGAALRRPPRLLQRDQAWSVLRGLAHGRGVGLVLGEPGMGRSRLLEDAVRSFGWRLQLRPRPGDAAVPGALLARWLAPDTPDTQGAAAAVCALGAAELTAACRERARATGGLVIDDAQAGDAFSLQRLPGLLQALDVPAVVAFNRVDWLEGPNDEDHDEDRSEDHDGRGDPSRRDAALAEAWALLAQQPDVHTVRLSPWTETSLMALADDLGLAESAGFGDATEGPDAGDAARPAQVRQPADRPAWALSLLRHAGGVPRATLATLSLCGLSLPAQSWDCPDAEINAWLRWLDEAGSAVQGVVELAAVSEPTDGWADALPETHAELSAAQCERAQRRLRSAGAWIGEGAEGRVAAIVLAAARRRMTSPWAQVLHRALAERGERRAQPAAGVAAHWAAAGNPDRAAVAHWRAAQQAALHSRLNDAARHWRDAAGLWQQLQREDLAFAAQAAAGEMGLIAGDVGGALRVAEALAERAGSPREWAMALRLKALATAYSARWADLLDASERALRAASAADEPDWTALANLLWAYAAANLGRHEDALAALAADASSHPDHAGHGDTAEVNEAGQAADPGDPGDPAEVAEALEGVGLPEVRAARNGGAQVRVGDLPAAAAPMTSASLTPHDLWGEDGRARRGRHQIAGLVWQVLGRPEQALARMELGLALSERAEAQTERFVLLSNLAAGLNAADRRPAALVRARQGLAEAVALGQEAGMPGANVRMHVGMIAGSLGELDVAVEELQRAADDLRRAGIERLAQIADHHLAQQWMVLGQPARALALLADDAPDLSASHRVRRWTLRTEVRLVCDLPSLGEAMPGLTADVDRNIQALARLAQLHGVPAAERAQRAGDLAEALRRDGLVRTAFGAAARELDALVAASCGDGNLAKVSTVAGHAVHGGHGGDGVLAKALALEHHIATHDPDTAWQAEAWLALHRAWTAMGEPGRAEAVALKAGGWLSHIARRHVPSAWQHGFLQRHRRHAELMRLWRVAAASGRASSDAADAANQPSDQPG